MLIALGVIAWIVFAVFALRGARWAYAIFLILALVWIPARTGFHFRPPQCQMQLTLDLILFALTKYRHIFLFGMFFLMTRVQVVRAGLPHAFLIAFAATIAVGVLIELEETLTRTGTCALRDLFPDAAGALIGEVIARLWERRKAAAVPS